LEHTPNKPSSSSSSSLQPQTNPKYNQPFTMKATQYLTAMALLIPAAFAACGEIKDGICIEEVGITLQILSLELN